MNKILKSISMCGAGIAATLMLATAKASATNYRVTPSEGLNVRAAASASEARIGGLTVGDVVDVLEIKNGWGHIKFNNQDGWVCMEYLELVSAEKQTYQVIEPLGLNVRSGPGTDYGILGAICVNTKVDVTEIRGNWGKISYGGSEGWICLDYARPVGSSPVPAPTPVSAPASVHRPVPTSGQAGNFSASNEIVKFIKTSEGFVPEVTEDPLVKGVYQIGYGHVLKSGESFSSITEEQAHALLTDDLNRNYGRPINMFLRGNGITANKQQFDALLSFTYNFGTAWMKDDRRWDDFRKFIVYVRDRNLSNMDRDAFTAEVLQYHHTYPNGVRNCEPGLLFRRIDEMNVFFYGDYGRHYGENPHDYKIPDCIKTKL